MLFMLNILSQFNLLLTVLLFTEKFWDLNGKTRIFYQYFYMQCSKTIETRGLEEHYKLERSLKVSINTLYKT